MKMLGILGAHTMKRFFVKAMFLGLLFIPAVCWGEPYTSTKIIPESVDYPLVRTKLYPHKKETYPRIPVNFETMFGVRRFLMMHSGELDLISRTRAQSQNTLNKYKAYGPLGLGEEIFTPQARIIREQSLRK
jgi:hypothetical protein